MSKLSEFNAEKIQVVFISKKTKTLPLEFGLNESYTIASLFWQTIDYTQYRELITQMEALKHKLKK